MFFLQEEFNAVSDIELVVNEIHILATHYHWSRKECWECPMTERKVWRDLVLKHYREIENRSK